MEEEQQLRGVAGRGIREAFCPTYDNHTLPPHPNPSSQPAEFPSLELKTRPDAGKRVRACVLSFQQHSCVERIWSEFHNRWSKSKDICKICSLHLTLHRTSVCVFPLFQVYVYAKRGSRIVNGEARSQEFSEVKQMPFSGFLFFSQLFLNGSSRVPWSTCLLSEECWSWSVEPKGVLWKCKYDKKIIQPGPESSQDTSPTCRHRELWCFSREQAGILPSLLACDDDGLTQPALACGGQLKTTPRS